MRPARCTIYRPATDGTLQAVTTVHGAAPKPRAGMSLYRAMRMYEAAHDWPSHGDGWPANAIEREADRLVEAERARAGDQQ